MSGPLDFDELMEGASPDEEARLRRVHDLLVAAGPPPELPPALAEPPALRQERERPPALTTLPRRRFGAVLVAAAGIAAATFIAGWVIGDHRANGSANRPTFDIQMRPTAQAPASAAVLAVEKGHDDSNIPMTLTVSNLRSLPKGGYYQLWLTRVVKHGGRVTQKLVVSCGTFVGASSTRAPVTVKMNAPYTVDSSPGWVITRHVPGAGNDPVVLTT